MSDLHRLVISAPDGAGYNATVTLDGQPIRCESITLRCSAQEVTSAVIALDCVAVEFDGLADVVAKIVRDEAPVIGYRIGDQAYAPEDVMIMRAGQEH